MKRILHSLFYILSLSLCLGGLAGASSYDDETSFLLDPSYDSWIYDHEASSDTDDVAGNLVVLDINHSVAILMTRSPDSRLLLAARLPDARGPPRSL